MITAYPMFIGPSETDVVTRHMVMIQRSAAHKVHVALHSKFADGHTYVSGARCDIGRTGSIVADRDFTAVTCKQCGCDEISAHLRNAGAVALEIA